jgi:hypothetical protein
MLTEGLLCPALSSCGPPEEEWEKARVRGWFRWVTLFLLDHADCAFLGTL